MVKSSHIDFNGDIHVQTMHNQSGIFIGERNIAIGWSAHGKENRVIGNISGHSNLLFHNISILNDPDLIDTPIDDRDINLTFDYPQDEAATTNLNLESLNVNAMLNNNSIVLGKGHINGMDANHKVNYSLGNLYGSQNQLTKNVNIVHDEDVADGIIEDQDIKFINMERE
ncbi:hypothetical protein ACF5W4_09790 [Bacillota bacterium Lsc_1132]